MLAASEITLLPQPRSSILQMLSCCVHSVLGRKDSNYMGRVWVLFPELFGVMQAYYVPTCIHDKPFDLCKTKLARKAIHCSCRKTIMGGPCAHLLRLLLLADCSVARVKRVVTCICQG